MSELAIKELSSFWVKELQMRGVVERVWRTRDKLSFAHLRVAGIRYQICIPAYSGMESMVAGLVGKSVWAMVECLKTNDVKRYRLIHIQRQSERKLKIS
ncbi:MAG: hypothetical protein ACRC9L_02010 [Brevinema sp.]